MATISDADYLVWLADNQNTTPVVLVVATHSAGTKYISDRGYVSYTSDTPANQYFDGILTNRVVVSESMSALSVGKIEVYNDSSIDAWLDLIWHGYPIKIYQGDARWKFSNFRLVFDGYNGGLSAPSNDRFAFSVLDSGAVSLAEKIGADLSPVAFGWAINVPPALIDFATLTFKYHSGPGPVITVRDNGIQLTLTTEFTFDYLVGEMALVAAAAGQITIDVQGSGYLHEIIPEIVTFGASFSGDQLLEIADAALEDPNNTNSTVFSAINNGVVTTPTIGGGIYVVNIESDSVPTAGGGADLDISDLVTGSLDAGTTVRLQFEARHSNTGTGTAQWEILLVNSSTADTLYLLYRNKASLGWVEVSRGFIYGTGEGEFDIFRCHEFNSNDDGSVDIRNMYAWKSPIQLDSDTLYNMNATQREYPHGYFSPGPVTIKEILDYLLGGIGAFYRINTAGKMEFQQLDVPATSVLSITEDDIKDNGLTLKRIEPPVHNMTLRYAHNWKVQSADGIAGAVTTEYRELYSREWIEVTKENSLSDYPIQNDKVYESGLWGTIGFSGNAQNELDRRQVIRASKRETYDLKTYLAPGLVKIGDTVNVTYPKYGFDSGRDVVVLASRRELGRRNITLTIWS